MAASCLEKVHPFRSNIDCLRIYLSISEFCTAFRSSFRRLKYDDSEDTIRRRHVDSFYWFGRFLECALVFYGKRAKRKQTFYHGLNSKFLFDAFSAVFEIPLSTTDDISIATNFASGGTGVILCFAPKFKRSLSTAHYLEISGSRLSRFDEERELLVLSLCTVCFFIHFDVVLVGSSLPETPCSPSPIWWSLVQRTKSTENI